MNLLRNSGRRPKPLVILVHPGSLCGSFQTAHDWQPAWPFYADVRRKQICAEFTYLDADKIVVLGSELDDEISHYPTLQCAVDGASRIYKARPDTRQLIRAADRIWSRYCERVHSMLITGAWADPGDGCAWTIFERLRGLAGNRFRVHLSPLAPRHALSCRQIENGPIHPLGNSVHESWHVRKDEHALRHNELRLQEHIRLNSDWARLAGRLKSIGGSVVCASFEEDMDLILSKGRTWVSPGCRIIMRRGEPRNCHQNVLGLWEANRHFEVVTGYALSADGIWRSHSWCFEPDAYRIVETTTKRAAYHGAPLSQKQILRRLAAL